MTAMITMAHGSGGEAMRELIAREIAPLYRHRPEWDDAAIITAGPTLAVTTDSFVVSPLIFPGGDVGKLAACGTINDLAMRGAIPRFLTVGLIIEEGLPLATLRTALASLRGVCDACGVAIIAGDTKVVERGSGDGLFINTTGIGLVTCAEPPGSHRARPGDQIMVNGYLGDHGVAILTARNELPVRSPVASDCAALDGLVQALLAAGGEGVHVLRDPTRGGLAAAVNEIAADSGVTIALREADLPIRPPVRGACEVLGLDPLQLANEGKLVAFVAPAVVAEVLAAARRHPLGAGSAIIGEVIADGKHRVTVRTSLGTTRILAMPAGELLPRIC